MKLQKTLLAAVVAAAIAPATASAAFLNNWTFDITGSGNTSGDGVTFVNEYLDLNGTSYVDLDLASPVGPSTFNFQDVGAMLVTTADGGANPYDTFVGGTVYETSFIFELSGQVTLGGNINFSSYAAGDYVELWVGSSATGTYDYGTNTDPGTTFGANNGTQIGVFQLNYGAGNVDVAGIPNGQITIVLEPTVLAAGYFFDSNGNDMSAMVNGIQGDGPLFGFVTTNASLNDAVNTTVNDEIVMELAGDPSLTLNGDGVTYGSDAPDRFVVGNNGQYRWSVPEPGTIALLGMGLIGLAGAARRRKA